MRALVLREKERLEVAEVPTPSLAAGHVLVKVSRCGICGSDVRYFHGENPWAKQTLQQEIPNPPNIILGHEFAGTVVDARDAVDRGLISKRVGVNTFTTCGRCRFCRAGRENFCKQTKHLGHGQGWGKMDYYPGGMAEYCPVSADQVYELPENVSDEQATFLDPIIAALHAVDVGDPHMLDRVVVLGAGPIGLLIAQLAKIRRAARTYITDVAERNLAVAREVGVDRTLNAAVPGQNLRDLVMGSTDGHGVERVFNTVGSSESITESLGLLTNGGVLVLMATKDKDIRFPSLMLSGERAIRTSSNALFSDFPRALDLLRTELLKVTPLVTHRFALSHGIEAFRVACGKEQSGAIKIVLDCQS